MTHGRHRFGLALFLALAATSPAHAQSPRITSFTPEGGPPGTLVKIIGERLDAVSGVYFHGVESPTVSHVSDQHLKAIVPEGATTGPIGLVGRDGLRTYTLRPFVIPEPAASRPPLALALPSPSPTAGSFTIGFSLSTAGRARLSVFNLSAQRLRVLVEDEFPAGPHVRSWDGRDDRGRRAPSGLYFVQLEAEGRRVVRRMILIR